MPQNVADADLWTVTVQCAADGEAVDGASQLLPAQDLGDRSRWLYNRSIEASGGAYQIPIAPVDYVGTGVALRWSWAPGGVGWINSSIGGAEEMLIPLPALTDCTFDTITLYVEGDGGGGGPHIALPAVMPRITLYQIDAVAGTLTAVGNQIDTSGAFGVYDLPHTIALAIAAQTVDSTTQYAVSVRGESGANSIAGALCTWGCTMNIVPA